MTSQTAQIIDGNQLASQLRADVARRTALLQERGLTPGLAVILVGDNPASQVYVRNKVKACQDSGLYSLLDRYEASLSEAALLERIDQLNQDPTIHGILVQLPLPAHINADKVIEAIAPEKDVDGFHVASAGALMVGQPGFWPCTPYGCMKMLESIGYNLRGKHAVVIGRSNIVGKPMAMMLLQQNATVTICHSATANLKSMTLQADVIVAAVGKRNVLTADMVKPGAVVIDVGMNRNDEGKLCGDVDFAGLSQVASYITPVPGGVGPMTITMLLVNTLEAAERAAAAINPLLSNRTLPEFDRIQPQHIEPAIQQLLDQASRALETVTAPDFPANWNAIATELDVATEKLSLAWGSISHLNSVADNPEQRAAYNAMLPKVTEFWTRLGADERLYAKYKAISPDSLNCEQQQAHSNAIRNFVLGGAELQGRDRIRFAEIQEKQAAVSQKFSENTLDATDAFSYYAQLEETDGIPEDVLQAARAAAQVEGKDGYKLTLKMPCYLPVMQFAHNSALRATLYRAYVTRASDQADPATLQFDNSTNIQELLALRQEEAKLLGHAHFGALSLVPKMADSAETVIGFLRDLAHKARPFAEKDVADLREFACSTLGINDPQPWDWPFISEKLKEARYAFSEQAVKQYFTLPKVLAGLFGIIENLFEVVISPDKAPVWHADVQFYRIERRTPEGMQLVGQFYLDPTARNGKRGGAWMDDVRTRWLRPDTQRIQTPIAHLVCNFAQGLEVDGVKKPALLSHDDVITLFHEFGHGLHHLLSQVNERDVSGISGVEWDAVELPSQFMENFCWEWNVLQSMTAHIDTGAPLPRDLYDKMLAARNFQSGMQTLRQIEFSMFDMLLHTTHDLAHDCMAILQQVRDEVAVLHPPAWSRTAHTFSHIFAGGYAAGYYSYKWAEVLSADAYAAFEETVTAEGKHHIETGRKYRQEILEKGGSRPAMESFKAFRGREPNIEALLRHQGMTVEA
jgi:oligopeptidase A